MNPTANGDFTYTPPAATAGETQFDSAIMDVDGEGDTASAILSVRFITIFDDLFEHE